ncbi:hypothetical protein RND71_028521 [Anisodus tanguticus]|uniref:Uncharacterized protein n=1 Tax=Anisodus tanguticus TaxID=243964 RepID=A0AAE1V1P3_9SOLA|nr:hypothetical protein RND71_028521 [Anisodus tanguticus]
MAASGKEEGNQVGLKMGFRIGEELGFYRGCIDVWNAAILSEPTCFSSRVQKGIKQMDELMCQYPFSDPEDESATDIIDSLRLKFKSVCATPNIRLEYDGYPKASGIDKSGF